MLTIHVNKRQVHKGIEFSKKTFLNPRIYEQFMCCCKLFSPKRKIKIMPDLIKIL
jgi:hypothetical protein